MKVEELVANQAQLQVLSSLQLNDAQLVWDLADAYEKVEEALTKFNKKRAEYAEMNGSPDASNPGQVILRDPEDFAKKVKMLLEVDTKITFPIIPYTALKGQKFSISELASWKRLGIVVKEEKKKDAKK